MLQTHEEIPAQSTILNSQKEPEVVSNGAMGVWEGERDSTGSGGLWWVEMRGMEGVVLLANQRA